MGAAWQHGAGAGEEAQPESTNGVRSARWDGSETLQAAKGRVSQRALFSGSYRVLKEELFSRLDLISLQKILIDLSGGERGLPLATRWACLTVCTLPLHKRPSGNLCVWETWKFGQIQGQAAIQVANSKPHFCLRLTRRHRIGVLFYIQSMNQCIRFLAWVTVHKGKLRSFLCVKSLCSLSAPKYFARNSRGSSWCD